MTSSIDLQKVVPILRIFSVEKAKEFYLGFLGSNWDWEHRYGDNFPLYAQVSRGGLAFHRELTARDYHYYKPGLEEQPWARTITVQDPFGNKIIFSEPLDNK